MSIKLSVEIESPLTPDDRDLLAGVAMMTLAIANRELGQQAEEPAEPPQPCGALEYRLDDAKERRIATGFVCISEVGHKGRHRFRESGGTPITVSTEGMN